MFVILPIAYLHNLAERYVAQATGSASGLEASDDQLISLKSVNTLNKFSQILSEIYPALCNPTVCSIGIIR